MSEKAKVRETVGLYSKVFRLPSYRVIVFRMALIVVVTSGLASIFSVLRDPSTSLLQAASYYMLLLLSTVVLGTGALYMLIRAKGSPLDLRRTCGAVQFGMIFWFVLGLIGGFLDLLVPVLQSEGRSWLFGSALSYLLFSFIVTSLSEQNPTRNFLAAVLPLSVWLGTVHVLNAVANPPFVLPQKWYVVIPLVLIICAVAVHYIFRAVSFPFERDLGLSGPELLRAFGHDYLADNPEPFERLITGIAAEQDLPASVLVMRSGEKLVAVGIILYVHPGPFRDLGSSPLPSTVIEHVKKEHGVPAIVMHGTCTHHQNLTTKADVNKVLDEIDRLIRETPSEPQIKGPLWSDSGRFKVWCILAGRNMLAITTSSPQFTDDIALEVGLRAAMLVQERNRDVSGVAVVDAHNRIDEDAVSIMPDDAESEDYVRAVADAGASTVRAPSGTVQVGAHNLRPEQISLRDGLGSGGISALALKTAGRTFVLVSIDGNNMEPGVREEMIAMLKSLGADDAEVITTDTHVVNAVALSSKGYPPVGRYKRQEFTEAVRSAAVASLQSLQSAQVGIGIGQIEGLRTFGEKGFDILTADIVESSKIAKRAGIRAGAAAALLSYLLILLL